MSDKAQPIPLPVCITEGQQVYIPRDYQDAVKYLEGKYKGMPHHEQVLLAFRNDVELMKRYGTFESARRVHMDRIEAGEAPINSVLFLTMKSSDPNHADLAIPLWEASDPPAVYGVHWIGPARP